MIGSDRRLARESLPSPVSRRSCCPCLDSECMWVDGGSVRHSLESGGCMRLVVFGDVVYLMDVAERPSHLFSFPWRI